MREIKDYIEICDQNDISYLFEVGNWLWKVEDQKKEKTIYEEMKERLTKLNKGLENFRDEIQFKIWKPKS